MKLFKTIETSFNRFDETVRAYLSKTFASLNIPYQHSQVFTVIFDGIKGVMQNIMFYIEDALSEQNIYTARRKKSIYNLATLSGYEPSYGTAAVGTVTMQVEVNNGLSTKSSKIYIPNGCLLQDPNKGLLYNTVINSEYYVIDVSKPIINHELKVLQGQFNHANFVSEGKPLERFNITTPELFDKDYIEVRVDNELWSPVQNFYDLVGNSYIVTVGFNNEITIQFGNNVHGTQLKEGQTVQVRYLTHSGILGNITLQNARLMFRDYVVDAYGNSVNPNEYVNITVNNVIAGGSNAESINFVRNMVGKNSRSSVLATPDNFKLFLSRFSFIGYTKIWSEYNSMVVNCILTRNLKELYKKNTNYFDLSPKDILLSNSEQEQIKTTLKNSNRSFAGTTINIIEPIISKYALVFYIKAKNNNYKKTIEQSVKTSLAQYLSKRLTNTRKIVKSDIIKELSDINGIESIVVDIISGDNERAYRDGYYTLYKKEFVNGTEKYVPYKRAYEPSKQVGLDMSGNIELDSDLRIPLITGSIRYYYNKNNREHKYDSITMDAVTINFV